MNSSLRPAPESSAFSALLDSILRPVNGASLHHYSGIRQNDLIRGFLASTRGRLLDQIRVPFEKVGLILVIDRTDLIRIINGALDGAHAPAHESGSWLRASGRGNGGWRIWNGN